MGLALAVIGIGIAVILVRRPVARQMVKSQRYWFDRAYDENGVAWWYGFIGAVVAAFGVTFAAIALLGR